MPGLPLDFLSQPSRPGRPVASGAVKIALRSARSSLLSAERRIRSDALGGMAEDIVGLVIGLSLVGYLLYALARPERF